MAVKFAPYKYYVRVTRARERERVDLEAYEQSQLHSLMGEDFQTVSSC